MITSVYFFLGGFGLNGMEYCFVVMILTVRVVLVVTVFFSLLFINEALIEH